MISREAVLAVGRQVEGTFPPGLTNHRRGYTSLGGGSRLYAKLRRLDTEAEFSHLIRSFERIDHLPHFDQSLILAIAFRESGPLVLSGGASRVDSFHSGGLDRLFHEAPRLEREGLLPAGLRADLRQGSTVPTEGSTATRTRRAAAALIPSRDLLVAYGAVVIDRFNRFQHRASSLGLSLSGLDRRATRIWTALFFGGPNGLSYEAFASQRNGRQSEVGWMGSHFGAHTVMTFLLGEGMGAVDISRLDQYEPRMYDTTRTASAFIVTAEAEILDWLKVLSRNQ